MKFLHAALLALSLSFSILPSTAIAGMNEGNAAYIKKDYATALHEFELLANQGNSTAQFNLGLMYDKGQGVTQNDAEAVKWYRLAADQGNANAQVNLGGMYADGKGVTQNDIEVVKWYRLAADQGNAIAQFNLGGRYRKGLGVAQNDNEALKWYRLAATQGDATAQYLLGWMYADGIGVAQDNTEAVKWLRLAADQGHADAKSKLAKYKEFEKKLIAERRTTIAWTVFFFVLAGFITLFIHKRKQVVAIPINKSSSSGEIKPDFQSTVIDTPRHLDSNSPESLKHSTESTSTSMGSTISELKELSTMLLDGVLTQKEFSLAKARVLAGRVAQVDTVGTTGKPGNENGSLSTQNSSINIPQPKSGRKILWVIVGIGVLVGIILLSAPSEKERAEEAEVAAKAVAAKAVAAKEAAAKEAAAKEFEAMNAAYKEVGARLAKDAEAAAKVWIEKSLKDPTSVQYRNVKVVRDTNVCGEVNAKNGFGGYVGFKRFYYVLGGSSGIEPGNRLFEIAYDTFCTPF